MTIPPPPQDTGTRVLLQDVKRLIIFSDEMPGFDVTDLLQADNAAERKETPVSRGCGGSDARVQNIQLASKPNAYKLKIEKLWLSLTQKEVTAKTMSSKIAALNKRKESLESENRLWLRANEEILQRLRLSQNISIVAKKSLVGSAPNEFIVIAVEVVDAIRK